MSAQWLLNQQCRATSGLMTASGFHLCSLLQFGATLLRCLALVVSTGVASGMRNVFPKLPPIASHHLNPASESRPTTALPPAPSPRPTQQGSEAVLDSSRSLCPHHDQTAVRGASSGLAQNLHKPLRTAKHPVAEKPVCTYLKGPFQAPWVIWVIQVRSAKSQAGFLAQKLCSTAIYGDI